MRKRWIGAIVIALAAVAWWLAGAPGLPDTPSPSSRAPTAHGGERGSETAASPRAGSPRLAVAAPRTVSIGGAVIEQTANTPVPGVAVVLRGAGGEIEARTDASGKYAVAVPPGAYHAFVRDDSVISSGPILRVRLPGPPRAELVGAPDEGAMPLVVARSDLHDVDLAVVRAGVIGGKVIDRDGTPVTHAIVRARGGARPVLGTDLAETDDDGDFALRVPPGHYDLDVDHPQFAGNAQPVVVDVEAGKRAYAAIVLATGCVVTGRVVDADGKPAQEGAIEGNASLFEDNFAYAPVGRIDPDGSFRWTSVGDADVSLRAWPWKAPPSPSRTFHCREGARFSDVVFKLPAQAPSLEGVIVDAAGAPAPLAFLDVTPLDPDGIGQQERADGEGTWAVYDLPPGHYTIRASSPGRGVVEKVVIAPSTGARLQLSGAGRIEGTTTSLVDGGFEARFVACDGQATAPDTRLVTVTAGRFAIDDVPACLLAFTVRGFPLARTVNAEAMVRSNDTAHVELDLGPPRPKTIHGTVSDRKGPIAGARVTALADSHAATVRADSAGHYTIQTYAGAQLVVGDGAHVVNVTVGHANVPDEQIDLVVQ